MTNAYPTKMQALEAAKRGWSVKIPKPAGMVIYNFMKETKIKVDEAWFVNFYNQVVMANDWFPRTLPTHLVLYHYVQALKANLTRLKDNSVSSHVEAITNFLLTEKKTPKGIYTYRDLLYMKIDDGIDYLQMDDAGVDFSYLVKEKYRQLQSKQPIQSLNV